MIPFFDKLNWMQYLLNYHYYITLIFIFQYLQLFILCKTCVCYCSLRAQ